LLVLTLLLLAASIPYASQPLTSSWAGLYGGLGEDDVAWDVAQCADGGYLLVGEADVVASDPSRGLGRESG
jgi:hypothetical protein